MAGYSDKNGDEISSRKLHLIKRILSESRIASLLRNPNRRKSLAAARHFVSLASTAEKPEVIDLGESSDVWQIWLQGVDNAPPLAKFCSDSLENNLLGANVVRLNLEDALGLVDVPVKVLDRWRSGKIFSAGLTDLLRIGLLAEYGGTWADYSIFVSTPVNLVDLPHLLVYEDFNWEESRGWFCATYFMRSLPGDELMQLAFSSLSNQWGQIGQIDYFDSFWHLAEAARLIGPRILEGKILGSPHRAQSLMAALHDTSLEVANDIVSNVVLHKLSLKTSLEHKDLIRWLE